VTSAVGDFIIIRSRCGSPRKPAQNQIGSKKNELRRNGHTGAELARQHGEGDHQAKQQRGDRKRAATASLSRVDATATAGLLKPAGSEDRVMV
jgi:hypothetical protein